MQLAWALASRCMNGERFALSGTNPLAGIFRRRTSRVRSTSIRTRSSRVHAMKPVNAKVLGLLMTLSSLVGLAAGADEFVAGRGGHYRACRPSSGRNLQRTARRSSPRILASAAAVSSFSAKAVGHMWPSSRAALSLKPKVAYRVLNFPAPWKKQTTLPSFA